MPPTKLQWHGFDSLIGFIRATVSLGAVIAGGLWAMLTWAMDDRYVKHEDLQAAVVDIKHTIKDSARQVQCEALLDDIQRLEQTILHKTRSGEDSGLEQIILESDRRKLGQYGGCNR